MCNHDCFNCQHTDCINNQLTTKEIIEQNKRDYDLIPKGELMDFKRASHEDNVRSNHYRYNHSDKGREARRKYEQSEKGQEVAKKKSNKKIESGKNAERCRRYYQRKKAMREQAERSVC